MRPRRHVGLVDADDAVGALAAVLVRHRDRGAEEHLIGLLARGRVDDFGRLQALGEEADAAIDLAQAPLAVDVVGVLRAVAVGGGPGDDLDQLGALLVSRCSASLLQPRVALRRDVVLGAGRDGCGAFEVLVFVDGAGSLVDGFAHRRRENPCDRDTRIIGQRYNHAVRSSQT